MKKFLGKNDVEEALRRLDRLTQDIDQATALSAYQNVEDLRRLDRLTRDQGLSYLTDEVRENLSIAQETLSVVKKAKRGLFPIGNALIDDWGTEFDLQLRGC